MDDEYQPAERRPIRSRDTGWARRVARWLAGKNVSPNGISVAGMVAGVLAGGAFWLTSHHPEGARLWWIAGAVLVQLRLLANLFDGMVAIESRRASAVGELYNEVPDRVSDAAILIGFGYAADSSVPLGYLAASLAIFVSYVRAMGKVAGGDQEFCGPMAKPQRMFVVTVAAIYAASAPAGWSPIAAGTLGVIAVGCAITAARRLRRVVRTLNKGGEAP